MPGFLLFILTWSKAIHATSAGRRHCGAHLLAWKKILWFHLFTEQRNCLWMWKEQIANAKIKGSDNEYADAFLSVVRIMRPDTCNCTSSSRPSDLQLRLQQVKNNFFFFLWGKRTDLDFSLLKRSPFLPRLRWNTHFWNQPQTQLQLFFNTARRAANILLKRGRCRAHLQACSPS